MGINQIEHICNLIHETFEIPVFLLDENNKVLYEANPNFNPNPFYKSMNEIFHHFNSEQEINDYPTILTTNFVENFVCFSFKNENFLVQRIFVGPSLFGKLPDEQILGLRTDINPFANRETVLEYYSSLPILRNVKLLTVCKLLYFLVHRENLIISNIIGTSGEIKISGMKNNTELVLVDRKQNGDLHHNILAEMRLYQSIKEGRTDKLTEYLSITNKGNLGILSKSSYLRSTKNLAISGITLAAKAAIDGGLYSETALYVSDIHIQKIEEVSSISDIRTLVMKAFRDLADRVKQLKEENYSTTIRQCLNFIMDHIYEPITLSHLADLSGLHPNYLSTLFKKEIGKSFSEYLQMAKVEEAKQLLKMTKLPLSEIGSKLNYIDQSYFTKIFKKYTGLTPYQYRNKNSE